MTNPIRYKYRFEIIYENRYMKNARLWLRAMALGFEKIGIHETMSFTSEKDTPIERLKSVIKEAYESQECEVFHIEGGKIE
jgi:hypothetical protein